MEEPESTASAGATKKTRSRSGCLECRRLHRKCDEKKPHCDNCTSVGKQCSYSKRISWGGRPFHKSSFGQALATDVVPVTSSQPSNATAEYEKLPFVYSISQTKSHSHKRPGIKAGPKCTTEVSASDSGHAETDSELPSSTLSGIVPDWLPWLPKQDRSLLYYFAQRVAPCFTLHPSSYQYFCTTIVPMAVDTTSGFHLLSAVLISSLVHQGALSSAEGSVRCASLYRTCLRHLRQQDVGQNADVDNAFIATSLVLCLTEIISGGQKQDSWRMHLKGALAMLDNAANDHITAASTSSRAFLVRWSKSLQTIAWSSPQTASDVPTSKFTLAVSEGNDEADDYINLFDGFSTNLLPIFEEINDLSAEIDTLTELKERNMEHESIAFLMLLHKQRCDRLKCRLKFMVAHPTQKLDPLITKSAEEALRTDLIHLNQVYHYTALLELYQRVLDKPANDTEVLDAVMGGIRDLKEMELGSGACPAVATLHPIFTIGCSACTADNRGFVMGWLDNLEQRYKMGNVRSAKLFLIELWQRNDLLLMSGSYLQWDKLILEKEWDLSLY